MRDILFRGKRLDNGEGVYGFYCHVPRGRLDRDEHLIQTVKKSGKMGMLHCVDPSTVGQYTGLKDKNGKRIWEGDIIRSHYANTRKNDFVEQVVFHNGRFCSLYKITGPGNGKIWANLPDGVQHLPKDKTPYMEWCEARGNIHDNSELLEDDIDE